MKIGLKKTYAGVLDIPAGKEGGVEVTHLHKPAGTVLRSSTMRGALFGQTGEVLTFPEPTRWHELSEEGHGVWMTDLPIEQRQADELIARAKGRVLVGGLGLGYAVVALAARSKVTEIVVVEQNPAVISLVWKATVKRIKTLVPTRKVKLTIIHADLFDYLKKRQRLSKGKPEFQWALFDIWQSDGEHTFHHTVVPLRALAHGVVTSVACWNEDIMRGQLYNGLDSRLMMLRMTAEQKAYYGEGFAPSVEALAKDGQNIYQQWAVPFWKWFKDHAYDHGEYQEDLVRYVMHLYVQTYGRPEAQDQIPQLHPYRGTSAEAAVA